MSEMEELKKVAEKQKVEQRFEAVSEYINTLMRRCDEKLKAAGPKIAQNGYASLALMIVSLVNMFVGNVYIGLVQFVLLIATVFFLFRSQKAMSEIEVAMAEIDGAFKVLELLGYLDPDMKNRASRKKKVSMLEAAWSSAKKVAKWRPYGQPVANPV